VLELRGRFVSSRARRLFPQDPQDPQELQAGLKAIINGLIGQRCCGAGQAVVEIGG
jgi:hypothetical protein